ncbi:MAG TPA: hypothetical protein VFC26_12100 [Verrucomicrobiae bacterium]|nr:hypothetical protein [Verrucomicrobiae bacterium]
MVSTGLLLKTDSVWVESREEARAFTDFASAMNYCLSHGIEGARFVLSGGDPKLDTYMDAFGAEKRWLAGQMQMG